MDEILASIRRIIADDQMLPLTRSAPPAPPVAPAPVVQSTQIEMPSTEDFAAELRSLQTVTSYSPPPAPEPVFVSQARIPPSPVHIEPQPEPDPILAAEVGLLSPTTGASVSSAFDALASTMFLQNSAMVEEAVREMLRPLLKQWLDDNLPVMVERLVRTEIERVARGGRG